MRAGFSLPPRRPVHRESGDVGAAKKLPPRCPRVRENVAEKATPTLPEPFGSGNVGVIYPNLTRSDPEVARSDPEVTPEVTPIVTRSDPRSDQK